MAVTFVPYANKIEVMFRLASPSGAPTLPRVHAKNEALDAAPKVYTPYALLPGMILCPAVATPGGWNVGGLTYEILGPETQGVAFYGSHPRRPSP